MSAWINPVFDAQQVNRGGVVRRSIYDVATYASIDELVAEAKSRGFHVIETGDQLVILSHEGSLIIHC